MTTTASKAGLKAAATRRTKRHAQTTALPPRTEDVELALEAVVEAAAAKAAKPPTLKALRAAAKERGMAGYSRASAEAIQAFMDDWDRAVQETANQIGLPAATEEPEADTHVRETVVAAEAAALARRQEPEAATAAEEGDTKAHRNVQAFLDAGWKVTVQVDGTYAELIALRGPEAIHQAWEAGVYHNDSASYTIADRTVRTRNVAEAKRWAARTPEAAHAELAKVATNKAFVKKAPEKLVRYALPFDPATATETEVWTHLANRGIKWHNRLSNSEETAIVGGDPRWFRIEEVAGSRILLFCCKAQGFRALKLENLLLVGRPSRKDVIGAGDKADIGDEMSVSLSVDVE